MFHKISVTLISEPVDSSPNQSNSLPVNPNFQEQPLNETTIIDPARLPGDSSTQPDMVSGAAESIKVWAIFTSTFFTIFLAEMGDKTQITTLLITAESHNPWVVFLGAGSALITTSLLGVLLGQWLARHIQPQTLERAAGLTLLVISAIIFWEVFH